MGRRQPFVPRGEPGDAGRDGRAGGRSRRLAGGPAEPPAGRPLDDPVADRRSAGWASTGREAGAPGRVGRRRCDVGRARGAPVRGPRSSPGPAVAGGARPAAASRHERRPGDDRIRVQASADPRGGVRVVAAIGACPPSSADCGMVAGTCPIDVRRARHRACPSLRASMGARALDDGPAAADWYRSARGSVSQPVGSADLRLVHEDEEGIDPATIAKLLTGRAESLIEMGRHREAIAYATQARAIGDGLGDRRLGARALLALGRAESDAGRMRRARVLLEEARGEFGILGDVRGQGWALHRLSETWSRDDYSRELLELRKAYRLFARSRDRWGRSVAAQDLAYLLTTQGGPEFHRWFKEASRLAEDDRDLRSRAAVARTRGYFAYFCGEFGEAIRIMREARPRAAQAGDRYAEADTVLIGAMAAAAVGPPDEAERLSLEALELARELRSPRVRATGLLAGARAALRSGSPSLAQSRLRAARLIIEQKKIRVMRCEALLFDAWVALDRGTWDKVSNLSVRLGAAVRASDWLIPLVPLLRGRASLGTGRPDEA